MWLFQDRPPATILFFSICSLLGVGSAWAQLDLSLEGTVGTGIPALGIGGGALDGNTGLYWLSDGAGSGGIPPGSNLVAEIDPLTGTLIRSFSASVVPGLENGPDAVAIHPGTGDLFLFSAYVEDVAGRVTQGGVLVRAYASGHNVAAAAFHPSGKLYVVPDLVAPTLWKFGQVNGNLNNPVPLVGYSDRVLAADFDPVTGNLFLYGDPGNDLLELDIATGQILSVTDVSPFVGCMTGPAGFAFSNDGGRIFLTRGASGGCGSVMILKRCLPASFQNYGQGFPGSLGVPSITSIGVPSIGSSVSIQIGNSAGSPTAGLLIAGDAEAFIPGAWGGTLLVDPQLVVLASLPAGGLTIPWTVRADPALCFVNLYAQALIADPGAAAGIANTPGLRLTLGN